MTALKGLVLGTGKCCQAKHIFDFQRYICCGLAVAGSFLAVCSEKTILLSRRTYSTYHPDMVLRRAKDLASFVANWDDKATNLRRIASRLNIGLDSMVFRR